MSPTRRTGLVVMLAASLALPLQAADRWWESYNKGVAAVRAKNYELAAEALQRAVAEMPVENGAARARNEIITYVPHFWLGIARFNLSDVEGAMREWKLSEEQGAVQSTPYFAQLRDWEARAQSERLRRSESAAGESKKEANGAMGRAVSAQMEALAAGADRSDAYRAAQRKLQEAMDANARAGTEIRAYRKVADLATQSRELFLSAAEEAKKQRAARVTRQNPLPQPAPAPKSETRSPVVVTATSPPSLPAGTGKMPAPATASATGTSASRATPPPSTKTAAESEALVSARTAVQKYRQHLVELHLPTSEAQGLEKALGAHSDAKSLHAVQETVARKEQALAERTARARGQENDGRRSSPVDRRVLESAYRAFASGDLDASERQLSQVLASSASAEAYLLRGCARYTQAMLSRNRESLLGDAEADFRSALKLNRSLKLDRAVFSPKLVAYFEQIRKTS